MLTLVAGYEILASLGVHKRDNNKMNNLNNKINEFVGYVIDYYWHMNCEVLTKHEVKIALGKRLSPNSRCVNEHGKLLSDIPFEGDSFDREYVYNIMTTDRV